MSQILDHAQSDYRPPITRGLTIIASLYRGYTDTGEYTDGEHNLQVAREILREYWERNEPAISLVLQWAFLGIIAADDRETHAQAQEWCLTIVRKADALHLWYPMGMYLSRGMRLEWEVAQDRRIEVREFEREW